ncbi:MAG: hemerythrin domain-containing protein [Methanobacteriaceae archaeon]
MAQNLYEMLKQEHRDVQELFRLVVDQRESALFPEIEKKLCLHMESEEQFLYPPLEEVDRVTILEGYEEHKIAKRLIKEILTESESVDKWFAKTKVLKEIIDHHIKDEERNIFDVAQKTLDEVQEAKIMFQFKEAGSKLK